jgi:hypothetical protein
MEREKPDIHIPGVDTKRIRYKKHPDGSPIVTMAVLIEPEVAEWIGTPIGKVIYDVKNLRH